MRKEFLELVNNKVDMLAEDHIGIWKERYIGKTMEHIEYDLRLAHDMSGEINYVEEELGYEMSNKELKYFLEAFIEAVIRNI